MEAVLQALADESRRTMLAILRDHPATVGELAAAVPIARPGVSRHLRVLREAGLVEVEQQAQWRRYHLRAQPLAELDDWLEPYRAIWRQRLAALHTEVARGKRTQSSDPTEPTPRSTPPATPGSTGPRPPRRPTKKGNTT